MSAGIVDATPLFESYHAFANMPSILSQLAKYEVAAEQSPEAMYSFEQDGFYATLTRRVRAHFGAETAKQSVMPAVKADLAWALKVGTQVLLNCFFYYQAFVRTDLPTPLAALSAALSGLLLFCVIFCAMHDASHFALGARNHWANELVTRILNAIALWSCRVWMYHHSVRHHSFTGSAELDPDVSHALPLVRKHPDTPRRKAFALSRWLGDTFGMAGWSLACGVLYVLIPGMWFGQVQQYFRYRTAQRRMWNMPKLASIEGYETRWWENALYAAQLLVQYRRGNIYVTLAHVIALNFFYSMAIVADHDLVESAITNHLDVDLPRPKPVDSAVHKPDWGEVQVRNTTNFVNDKHNLFAHAFGGINYQTEHHLFPGVSHMHLHHIAPIVQQTCADFGIPYTVYPSLFDAWHSFVLVVCATMTGRHDAPRPNVKTE
jgi:fatty acid desaturase